MTTSGTPSIHPKGLCGLLVFLLCALVASAKPEHFDIPAQAAPAALKLFNKQSSKPAVFITQDLQDVQASAVQGDFEPADALTQLLAHTGFEITKTTNVNFVIGRSSAQVTTGSVRGSLVGEGGKGASGVLVTIRETAQSAETDRYGIFAFPNVAAGTYVLVASAPGYQTMHIDQVQVRAGRDLTIGKEEMRKLGEGVLKLEPFVVHADTVEQLEKFEVTAAKPQPFSDRNVDLPRTINDVQPYYIFDSRAIEESGTTSVEDFLKQRLTMNTTVRTSSQTAGTVNTATGVGTASTVSSINLNGLGADHTLVLVNGRQMPGVLVSAITNTGAGGLNTPGQPDVNGIPLGAIDRIEILPSSAGAIYGASAEGGVINIVLKKAYKGGDISVTYGSTWDGNGPSHAIQATIGTSFNHGRTQLLVSAQYSDQTPLLVEDRASLRDQGFNTIFNRTPAFFLGSGALGSGTPFLGTQVNFRSSPAGQTLTFVGTGASFGSAFGTVPLGYTATSSPTTLIPGQWNFVSPETNQFPNGSLVPLGAYPRRRSLLGTITHDISDKFQVYADYSYSGNHAYSSNNGFLVNILLPAGAPSNPFNQGIVITVPTSAPLTSTSDSIAKAVTAGGRLKLPFSWVANADYQWSQSQFNYFNITASGSAITTSSPTFGTLSPSGVSDPNPTPLYNGLNPLLFNVMNPINLDQFLQYFKGSTKSTLNDVNFAASGPIGAFPWGEPRLSIRLEHAHTEQPAGNTIKSGYVNTPYPGLPDAGDVTNVTYATSQIVDSANAEIDLPIFKTKLPFLRALDFQFNISVQESTYDIGTAGYKIISDYPYNTTPAGTYILAPNTLTRAGGAPTSVATGAKPYTQKAKLSSHSITGPALSYKPFNDLIIRGSVASGYVPPSYLQLMPTNFAQTPATTSITDPKQNGIRYNITSYALGGNPDLNPTTSKSWDVGVIWQPHQGPLTGLRVDVEYVETKQLNQIYDPGVQGFINLESLFPGQVVRDSATGNITTVYDKYINAAESKQSALTYQLDYSRKTALGTFDFSAAATVQEHNQRQLVAATPFLEYVGFPSAGGVAKMKGTATLRWSHHNWVAGWTIVSFGKYYQKGAIGDPGTYATQLQTGAPYTLNTQFTDAQGSSIIPTQTYHNLYLSYAFPKREVSSSSQWRRLADSLLDGVKVSLVVNNVFNTIPPLDAFYSPFYISPYGDVQLRNYAITLKKSF